MIESALPPNRLCHRIVSQRSSLDFKELTPLNWEPPSLVRMDHSYPYLRLDVIVTPAADITHLWRTFRPVDRAFLRLIIGDLPLLADSPIDWTLLRTTIRFRDEEIHCELQHGWDHSIRTEWLIDFIHAHALNATEESYQRDACHGFLLLIFGTIMFSYSLNLIDGALIQVILQVVGGHSYVEAVLAETIRSLDYIREIFLQRWIALHTASGGRILQLYSHIGFYGFERFDVYGAPASFRSSTSQSTPLTTSVLSQPLQHMWRISISGDLQLFVSYARHEFRGHRRQTFQTQRAPSKEPCAQSCNPLERSEFMDIRSVLTDHRELQSVTAYFCTTGESCQPLWVDHPRSSLLHSEMRCDQRPSPSRPPIPHNRRVMPTIAGRPLVVFTLPPRQDEPWPEGRSTFLGKVNQH
ncbi:hypothetical protein CRG98_012169 [Punica granatum]|uniref:Aminotransferase-like plant mobile domain-containing protein n=1 Tax=Punica granatum TaxID=22663 RepID=A0A2I0KGI7_PUNGR|nr:hypothetical protein CRG98_012169 [Punica granatum]